MTRVFMLMPHDKNVSSAKSYGTIELVFDRTESRPSIWDEAFLDEAIDRLRDQKYDPTRDYVLVAGAMVPTVLFVARLVAEFGRIRLLCFDIVSGQYVTRVGGDIAYAQATGRVLPSSEVLPRGGDQGSHRS